MPGAEPPVVSKSKAPGKGGQMGKAVEAESILTFTTVNEAQICVFLREIAECFTCLSHRLGICLSVHLSVRHTCDLYQNGAS